MLRTRLEQSDQLRRAYREEAFGFGHCSMVKIASSVGPQQAATGSSDAKMPS